MIENLKNDEVSLKELIFKFKGWFGYLMFHFKIILLCGILGAILGLTYSFLKKPVYTAKLSFGLEDDKGSGSANLASQFGLDIGSKAGGLFNGENLIILFRSRNMIERALLAPVKYKVKTISVAELYIINNKFRNDWAKKPKLKALQFLPEANRTAFSRTQDSVLGTISSSISGGALKVLQLEKKSSVVDIEFSSNSEQFAYAFTNSLVAVVSDFYVKTKSKKAKINLAILERQTDSIRGILNGNIVGVAVANDNTFALNPALNVKRVPSARKQVDLQANSAILSELIKQCELAKVNLRKETPLIQIIDSPILPLQMERFGKLKGLVLGGFLGGFFIVLFLICKRSFKTLLA